MNIQMTKKLLADFKQLQQSISVVINDLENIAKIFDEPTELKTNKINIPSDEILRNEWRELQQAVRAKGSFGRLITEFVQSKTKAYLQAFFKANDLPISNKDPKDNIAKKLVNIIHVGSTITGKQ